MQAIGAYLASYACNTLLPVHVAVDLYIKATSHAEIQPPPVGHPKPREDKAFRTVLLYKPSLG